MAKPVILIPMDRRVLAYLVEHGGQLPSAGIPSSLFIGEIPEGLPSLEGLGVIEKIGTDVAITPAGRAALAAANLLEIAA